MGIREYARHRGVTHVAVLHALRDGRISRLPSGKISVEQADRDWASNTDPSRTSVGRVSAMPVVAAASQHESDLFGQEQSISIKPVAIEPDAVLDAALPELATEALPAEEVLLAGQRNETRSSDELVALEYRKHRADRERLASMKAQVEYDQMMGRLIDKDWAIECAFTLFRALRDSLMNLPARTCHGLAVEVEPDIVEQMLEAEIRACFAAVNVQAVFAEETDG